MMPKSYGQMISFNQAITWAEGQPDSTVKEYALRRLRYERDRSVPVEPTYHKGIYGRKYDHYTCGHCGAGISEAHWKYCPNCGFAVKRRE